MVVPSGIHEVPLVYQPWAFSVGAAITFLSIVWCITVVLFRNRAYGRKWIDLTIVACGTVVILTSVALVSMSADDPSRRAGAHRSAAPINIDSGTASLSLTGREQSVSGTAEVDIDSLEILSGVTFVSYKDDPM